MAEIDQEKQERTVYEIGYLLLPSIAEEKVGEVAGSIKNLVSKAGGVEIAGEEPFMQDLAYTMNKTVGASRYVVNEAYLGWTKFELSPDVVEKVKAEVEKMPEVLRFLMVKAPRETTFTFAEARKAIEEEEKSRSEEGDKNEEGAPVASGEQVVE